MMMVSALGVFVVSLLLTGVIRHYARRRGLLDAPTQRSSHTVATPRGGGLAIAIIVTLAALLSWPHSLLAPDWQFTREAMRASLLAAGLAAVGFWDDHGHVNAGVRLAAHLLTGAALVWLLPRFSVPFLGLDITAGALGAVLLILLVAWYINVFNFMDGINGIAAYQGLFVFAGYGTLAYAAGEHQLLWPCVCIVAAIAGFSVWNFPRAGIFMGDVGSVFLGGLSMGLLFVLSGAGANWFWGGLILSGVFVVDATYTLLHRAWRGEPLYAAHRTHAYQYAARRYESHTLVTLAVGVINLVWLLPMAWLAGCGWLPGWAVLAVAYTPLLALAVKYKAGSPEAGTAT
jgi:Fuc2NAc and GlcNAc transferase